MDNSPLSKLSAELRNDIYERVLFSDKPFRITAAPSVNKLELEQTNKQTPPAHSTTLLQVCKQTRSESSQLFYAVNKFTIICGTLASIGHRDELWVLKRFMKTIGKANSAALRSVDVEIDRKDTQDDYLRLRNDPELPQGGAIALLHQLPSFGSLLKKRSLCRLRLCITFRWKIEELRYVAWGRDDYLPITFTLELNVDLFKASQSNALDMLERRLNDELEPHRPKLNTLQLLRDGLRKVRRKSN